MIHTPETREKMVLAQRARRAREAAERGPDPTERTCVGCGRNQSITEYKLSKGRRGHRCRDCRRGPRQDRNAARHYGLEPGEYGRMLAEQGGVCAICGQKNKDDRALAIDHDHETGAVRGLLCVPCNGGIGWLGDDPTRLRLAADYLDNHKSLRS